MQKHWWQEAVVYQVYPRSFQDTNHDGIGDLQGVINHLDYIKELGADVVWLNPIYQSPNDDNGYDISNYQAIMKDFGTMADFEALLKRAHEIGLKIVMDLVVNHTSDEHQWFMESRKSKDNPYRDYYIWHDPVDGHEPNNWGSAFSGPAWKFDEKTGQYYLHLFSPKQPDLNWENPDVRNSVFKMMTWWLDKGIDGFRMDVINMISKKPGLPDGVKGPNDLYGDSGATNGPKVNEYLKEMNQKVLSKYDIMTVGETPGATPKDAENYAGFDTHELNMVFQFEHMGLDGSTDGNGKWSTNRVPLVPFKQVMSKWQTELSGRAWNSLYWNNHDQPRVVSRFGNDKPEYRVLSAKMLATCLHMMQGTPYVYQGEEIGMTNVDFQDIHQYRDLETLNAYHELVEENHRITPDQMMADIHAKSRDNARTPMQWNTDQNAGFSDAEPWLAVNPNYPKINVKAALADHDSVFYYYQALIKLRHTNDIVVYGDYELLLPDDQAVYAYQRHYEGKTWLVICNFTDKDLERDFSDYFTTDTKLVIGNYSDDAGKDLRPYEAKVYQI